MLTHCTRVHRRATNEDIVVVVRIYIHYLNMPFYEQIICAAGSYDYDQA